MNISQALLPVLLFNLLENDGDRQFFFSRQNNNWIGSTPLEFSEKVLEKALYLQSQGVKKGDCVGIMLESDPDWLVYDFAVQCLGAITVPLFVDVSSEYLESEIRQTKMVQLFTNEEGVIKFKSILDNYQNTLSVIVHENQTPESKLSGVKSPTHTPVEICQKLQSLCPELTPDCTATIIFTSGSTGEPKGVELTHTNLLTQVIGAAERYGLTAEDRAISCLPLAHIFQRMVSYTYIYSRVTIHFVDDIKKTGQYIKELRPTIVTLVPRILEKVYAKMKEKAKMNSFLLRNIALRAIYWAKNSDLSQKKDAALFRLIDKLIFTKFRQAMGGELKYVISGGAALRPDIHQFFINVGIPVYQGYGCTETSPVIACQYPGCNTAGSVGTAFPGVEVKISDKGEICAKGPGVMKGYLNNPSISNEVLTNDGWYHTGDRGQWTEEGDLKITGRFKELEKTSGGKFVCVTTIEQKLARIPWVDMAMVLAHERNFVSCLLFADFEYLESLKIKSGFEYSTLENKDFLYSNKMTEKTDDAIKQVNSSLNAWEQIREYRYISNPPSLLMGEITPTMKICRHKIIEIHAPLIDSIYPRED
ncbi:MAG: AMP-binding protein [Planctomycetes bacterium]|nr:AMP-binding protein [Planctomycetota bacterium]